jgi:hypothetical protein
MAVTPSGMLSLPMECLRVLLANCTAWQSWTGTANATLAKARIYLHDIPAPAADEGSYTASELQTIRPFARIDDWMPERGFGDEPWKSSRVAERSAFRTTGKLVLDFSDDVDASDTANATDTKLRFTNRVGGVIEELLGKAGSSDYLSVGDLAAGVAPIGILSIEVYQGYLRSDQAETDAQGEHTRMQFLVHWGF